MKSCICTCASCGHLWIQEQTRLSWGYGRWGRLCGVVGCAVTWAPEYMWVRWIILFHMFGVIFWSCFGFFILLCLNFTLPCFLPMYPNKYCWVLVPFVGSNLEIIEKSDRGGIITKEIEQTKSCCQFHLTLPQDYVVINCNWYQQWS